MILMAALASCSEKSSPSKYLIAGGTYNENFWGDKLKIHGTITNTAKSATFKDAVIKVSYMTKTNSVIHTANYTLYEYFPPGNVQPFELKIDNYVNTEKLKWEVIGAKSD